MCAPTVQVVRDIGWVSLLGGGSGEERDKRVEEKVERRGTEESRRGYSRNLLFGCLAD